MIIGKNKATDENVSININTLIRTRGLIQASSGGGKSWIIRRLLEQTNGKVQQIVIDLDGEFETLREKFDYLLIAKNGDIPADIKTADLMARRLLELGVSAIIDISELKHHERTLYVKRFLDSLINAPKKLWHPCLIIVDEAHQFCPQGAKSDSASSVIDLMTRGRKRGFCGILATQRISKLNKDASAEGRNRFIGLAVQDVDRKRASEELGFTSKEDEISLRKLDDGEFFLFGPAISKEVIKVKVGGVQTTHPDVSKEDLKLEPTKTPKAIEKILKSVADIEKEAEEELKTIEDYKKKVSELKKEITLTKKGMSPQQVKVDSHALEKAKAQGFKEAEKQYLVTIKGFENDSKKLKFWYEKEIKDLENKLNSIRKVLGNEVVKIDREFPEIKPIIPVPEKIKIPVPESNPSVTDRSLISNESDTSNGLGICAKKIYSFLFNNPDKEYSKQQLGAITGYSHKSGGFNNSLYRLNAMGLISRNKNNVKVKEMDSSIAGEYDYSIDALISKLPVCPRKIYQLLLDNPYQEFSKEEIAESTGYSAGSGGFNNGLYRLNTLGLIERENNMIKLNPAILEMGK